MWWDPDLTDSKLNEPLCISDTEKAEHHHDVFIGLTKPRKLKKMSLLSASIVQEGYQRYAILILLARKKKMT